MIFSSDIQFPELVVTTVLTFLFTAAGTFGLMGKRQQDIAKIWKDMAEARKAENDDLRERLTRLEAKVETLTHEFAHEIASDIKQYLRRPDGSRD